MDAGDLKSVVVQTIGLKPDTYKLLFRGKEKEDDEDLQATGVKDNSKVVLMKDNTCRQTSVEKVKEEVKETSVISRGGEAVAAVRKEVDTLSGQVAALQAVVNSGSQVNEKDIAYVTEMLTRQLLKLDAIEAEGEGKVQRRTEVRRVLNFVETMDELKSMNSNLSGNANSDVPPPVPSSAKLENLERELDEAPEKNIGSANGAIHLDVLEGETRPVEENEFKKPKKALELPSQSQPQPSDDMSEFSPQAIKIQAAQVLLNFYWERICQKIMETPLEELSTARPTIDYLIAQMKKHMRDTTFLEDQLRSFFESASNFAQAKLECSQKVTQEDLERSFYLAQQDLFEDEELESEQGDVINGLKAELFQVNIEKEELKARLAELNNYEELINSSLHKAEEDLSNIQKRVADKKENISKLANTPYFSEEDVDALENMELLLEESRQNLAALDLFA
ncbi:hypothetical protein CDL12_14007 [Handroanthus impetiginosus]|uniref:Ubiquitin-like domain-containing protein n=1 Tax=Handroanthus impetiginosus TaxID=429701 RepID=A0A2G9H7A6_9LAMI|nr:hypothetical protein CDL12_14007 [Handroanthus impetiginosus]